MIYAIIRCFRPKKLIKAMESIKRSAVEVGVEVTLVLLLDGDKVPMEQAREYANQVGLPYRIAKFLKEQKDTYMVGPMNWAIQNVAKEDDWCVITDDDDQLLPGALEAIKENPDAEMVIWNTDNPYPYRATMNDVHDLKPGRVIGNVGWPNVAFKDRLGRKHPLIVSGGIDDGRFIDACLRDGVQPVYSGKIGCFYIAAAIQARLEDKTTQIYVPPSPVGLDTKKH